MNPAETPYVFPLIFPDDVDPTTWAQRYDPSPPRIYPLAWPDSAAMALVVVYRDDVDLDVESTARAYLVTRPEAMHALVDAGGDQCHLWFRIPRARITPAICPGLPAEAWPDD